MPMAWPNAASCRGDEDAARAAAGVFLDGLRRVGVLGVHGELRAVALGQLELVVGDVDGDDAHAHGDGVLDGDVSEAAGAGDDHELAEPGLRDLKALVDGDAGAEDRGDLDRVGALGDAGAVAGVDEHVFAEGAVDGVAAVLGVVAQGLPAGAAVLTGAAGECTATRCRPCHRP